MSVSAVGAPPPVTPIAQPEAAEPKGPDLKNDGDADDGAARVSAALPKGQGEILDRKA
jgi:hypothetical protein